jgi:NAD+ diphosphatase
MIDFLTGATIDRSAERRRDVAWLESRLVHHETRFLLLREGNPLLHAERPGLRFAAAGELPPELDSVPLFLGTDGQDRAVFAVEIAAEAPPGSEYREFRSVVPLLPRDEGALVAYARGVLHWHRRHRFCGVCGGETTIEEGGHVRHCNGCGMDHYPRTDPAVIVLVTAGERGLIGRQSSWPSGVYSVLAGFVEPGESLEEAVRREVREESAILVGEVAYRSSQPWPFPSSLMLGFRAVALSTEITVDRHELEDALWISRSGLREAVEEGRIRLPSPASIARRLLEEWLGEERPAS